MPVTTTHLQTLIAKEADQKKALAETQVELRAAAAAYWDANGLQIRPPIEALKRELQLT